MWWRCMRYLSLDKRLGWLGECDDCRHITRRRKKNKMYRLLYRVVLLLFINNKVTTGILQILDHFIVIRDSNINWVKSEHGLFRKCPRASHWTRNCSWCVVSAWMGEWMCEWMCEQHASTIAATTCVSTVYEWVNEAGKVITVKVGGQ